MTPNPLSFEELVRTSPVPVFVDFWAEWCGPCRVIAPSVQQLAEELKGRLTVVKVNVDEKPDVAQTYGIQSIPTLMLFREGRIIAKWIGAMPYARLKGEVEKQLSQVAGLQPV